MSKQIGLFGYGCVAQGFVEGLTRNPLLPAEVRTICVKDPVKPRTGYEGAFTTDPDQILNDPEIDIVIELIDDHLAAFEIATKALSGGKSLISANKRMVAEHLAELREIEDQSGSTLLYEGAVAGSIPILHSLQQFFRPQTIQRLRGILNGSTNYILTKMNQSFQSFEETLAEAQSLGFVERDPTLDISGKDAAYKASILAYHAFGKIIEPSEIVTEGIHDIEPALILESRKVGLKLKLVADLWMEKGHVQGRVQPQLISEDDPLYNIDDEYNGICVEGDLSGPQTYIGKGAGCTPTGSAVLNDLCLILDGFRYSSNQHQQDQILKKSA